MHNRPTQHHKPCSRGSLTWILLCFLIHGVKSSVIFLSLSVWDSTCESRGSCRKQLIHAAESANWYQSGVFYSFQTLCYVRVVRSNSWLWVWRKRTERENNIYGCNQHFGILQCETAGWAELQNNTQKSNKASYFFSNLRLSPSLFSMHCLEDLAQC